MPAHIRLVAAAVAATLIGMAITPVFGQPPCTTAGDGNGDCRIDLGDYQWFAACLAGAGATADPLCDCSDSDADGDVTCGTLPSCRKRSPART